jgi:hypothetical protein
MELKKALELPIIIATILMIASFAPFIQVTFLYLNSALVYAIELLIKIENRNIEILINVLFSILFIICYMNSKLRGLKAVLLVLLSIFLLGLANELFPRINEFELFFLPGLIFSLMVSSIIILVGFMRYLRIKNKYSR